MINIDLVTTAREKLAVEFALSVFSDDYIDSVLDSPNNTGYRSGLYYFNKYRSIPNLSQIMNGILEKYSVDELDALKIGISLITSSYPSKYQLKYFNIAHTKLKIDNNLNYFKFLKAIEQLLKGDAINSNPGNQVAIYYSIISIINQYGYFPKILENINKHCNFILEMNQQPNNQRCSNDKVNVIFSLYFKDKITEAKQSIFDYFLKAEDGQVKSLKELRDVIISEIFNFILNEADLASQRSIILNIIEDFSSNVFEYMYFGIFADILCNTMYTKICIQGNNYVTYNLRFNNQSSKEVIDVNIKYIAFIKNIIKYFEKTKLSYEDVKCYIINDKSFAIDKRLFLSKMTTFGSITLEDAYKLALFFGEDSTPFAQQMASLTNHIQFYFDGQRAARIFTVGEFKKLFKSKADVLSSVSAKNTDMSKMTKDDIFNLNENSIFLLVNSSDEDILKYIKSNSSSLVHRSLSTFIDFYKHPKSWQALSMKRDFIVLSNLILNADKFIIPTLMGRIELKTMKKYRETLNILIEKAVIQNE